MIEMGNILSDFLKCDMLINSVRVSNELGARHPKSAAFSVVVVTSWSFILSVIAAVIVLALRNLISYAFTEGEVVAEAVSDLCPLLALSLILNGIQPVLSGKRFIKHPLYNLKPYLKYINVPFKCTICCGQYTL